ncbi:uncharacterized protein G2W53_037187 [Senna tora]|uniref:Uncharacterized protein n=1 Tax=Senna tora TaxID=362788 RepID=A0A834SUY0_9FABA|nr:uncharacterized protein G2W53_037187 [Senna tora]
MEAYDTSCMESLSHVYWGITNISDASMA